MLQAESCQLCTQVQTQLQLMGPLSTVHCTSTVHPNRTSRAAVTPPTQWLPLRKFCTDTTSCGALERIEFRYCARYPEDKICVKPCCLWSKQKNLQQAKLALTRHCADHRAHAQRS
jgi:hypothetical protein